MSARVHAFGLVLAFVMCWSPLVEAARPTLLISRDYAVKGDGLLTYDTVTRLEWLNLTVTKGLSADDIGGWLDDRFRYPTVDELSVLFLHAGLGATSDVWLPELYAAAQRFISLIGATRLNEPNGTALYTEAAGIYKNPFAWPGPYGMSLANVATSTDFDFGNGQENRGLLQHRAEYYTTYPGDDLPTIGHWLVRDADKGVGPCR